MNHQRLGAHAQYLFNTDQNSKVMQLIRDWLTAE